MYNTPSTALKYLFLLSTENEVTLVLSKTSISSADTSALIYTLFPPEYDVNIP